MASTARAQENSAAMSFRPTLAAAACAFMLSAAPASAAFVVTMVENGGDVVISGSGSINTAALGAVATFSAGSSMQPVTANIVLGPTTDATLTIWGTVSGPSHFGAGLASQPSSGSGTLMGLGSDNSLLLPDGFVSGQTYQASLLFAGASFASLGVKPGAYVWAWGSGATADSFTLRIIDPAGPDPVPAPAGLPLFGLGLAGLALLRRKR